MINNRLSFKSCSYLQGTVLPPADPTCQKYSCIFIFIIFVFHGCHGSRIYTQQPRCHFQLQIELLCSQFGSAGKEISLYSRPSPVLAEGSGAVLSKEGVSVEFSSVLRSLSAINHPGMRFIF